MFRGKTFQVVLPGHSYRIFIEALKSPLTKAAYSYALQKYMNYLNYICGLPGMLNAIQKLLQEDLHILRERIKIEEFTGY